MKKCCCLILALYFVATATLFAQDLRLPRDSENLIDRVQRFWDAVTAGKRLQALEFVLPEKKELFLSGNPVPILKAKVVGVDLTSDPELAAIRIAIQILAMDAGAGQLNWTITDSWVWNENDWYLNLQAPPDIFRKSGGPENDLDVTATQKLLEQNFTMLRDSVDVGTLMEGELRPIEVPFKYTGDLPISVELAFDNPLVALEFRSSIGITRNSNHFLLLVNTESSAGPFNMRLPLKIRYQAAAIERTLLLKGNIFVPIAFRQAPPNGPIEAGRAFSLFIRNNTRQQLGVRLISVNAKFDIVKRPEKLPPNQEIEMILKLKPGEIPDHLYLELDAPLNGRSVYTYQFRNTSR